MKAERIENQNVPCARMERKASRVQCDACRNHIGTMRNFRRCSPKGWQNEPCIRDVIEGKCTIEESIANNHWKDEA